MYTKNDILRQLKSMNAPKDRIVHIHTSLRSVGDVEGRGEGFLNVLIEYFTEKGGILCVPTHTWENIGNKDKITLDMIAGKTCIGVLPDIAANHAEGIRSAHPTHSVAVFGENADEFVRSTADFLTPASLDGAYGRLYKDDGYVLLIGVGHNKNTYIHCVEEMLDVPNRISKELKEVSVRHKSGEIEKMKVYHHLAEGIGDVSARYPKYEPAFRYHGCITDGFLGDAPAQLCSARKIKEVVELIRERSGGAELLKDYEMLDEELYK